MSLTLRPIQENAIARVRESFQTGAKAVILQAVTGYGKTLIASSIGAGAVKRGNRVLFLAHQDILLRQMSRKLREFGATHGLIQAGFTPNFNERFQIASVQTMMRRIHKYRYEFELIMIDETHRACAQGYRDVVAAIPGARLLGFTGTPSRLDGRGLGVASGGLFDTLITTESPKEMIRLGYLVKPVYYASEKKLDLRHVHSKAGDYDETELAAVVDTPVITGSAVEHYKELVPGLPALTWCVNIRHAENTAAQFNAAGIKSIVLSGKSTWEERERGLAMLSRREVLNICFAQLLIEGVDVPALRALIFLRPTQSETAYLQVCGRGLRPDPNDPSKNSCIILDHAGLAFTHGLCDEDREWSLEGRQKKKKKAVDSLKLVQCAECFLIFEPKEMINAFGLPGMDDSNLCPNCRTVMQRRTIEGPQEEEGKLKLVTEMHAQALRKTRHKEVKNARTLEELKSIGKARGYSDDWADIQWGFKKRARERANERWGYEYGST